MPVETKIRYESHASIWRNQTVGCSFGDWHPHSREQCQSLLKCSMCAPSTQGDPPILYLRGPASHGQECPLLLCEWPQTLGNNKDSHQQECWQLNWGTFIQQPPSELVHLDHKATLSPGMNLATSCGASRAMCRTKCAIGNH